MLPSNDTFYKGRTCLPFSRSSQFGEADGVGQVREQYNTQSAFLDGTNIYGYNEERSQKVWFWKSFI